MFLKDLLDAALFLELDKTKLQIIMTLQKVLIAAHVDVRLFGVFMDGAAVLPLLLGAEQTLLLER